MKRDMVCVLVGLLLGLFLVLGFLFDPAYVYGQELTTEERELIAKLVKAEATGESELGQRLVIDTVLNRVESESFPNSVKEVIEQKNQYTTPSNILDDSLLYLVLEEELNKSNNEVIFFNKHKYPKYGEPLFVEGKHYFSKLKGDIDE